jgi:phosphate transport system substrate-binding protein
VKIKRHSAAVGFVAAGTLVLSACGSDPTAPPGQQVAQTPGVECGGKPQLTAEGSSAQANAFAQFSSAFLAQCPQNNIDYSPTGSGSGVKQFSAGQVDLGGSDSSLKDEEKAPAAARCKGNPALHLPLVFGPIAVAYNVEGVKDLVLTPEVTAKVFNGQIKTWNDPAIAAVNPGKNLPATPINVVYRNDDSGTTDNFQKYLSAAAPQAWTLGDGKKFNGGVGEGKAKSQGVADAVKNAPGSITYVESSYATNSGLSAAQIDSGAGPVALNNDSAGKAIQATKVKEGATPNDLVLDMKSLYGSKTPGAYPLMLVTYELVCSKGYDPEVGKAVKSFLKVSAGSGQDRLTQAGYVPLPAEFRAKVNTAIDSMS